MATAAALLMPAGAGARMYSAARRAPSGVPTSDHLSAMPCVTLRSAGEAQVGTGKGAGNASGHAPVANFCFTLWRKSPRGGASNTNLD